MIATTRVKHTLNNFTEADVDRLRKKDNVQYLIAGTEVGKNGTPHIQGYLRLKRKMRFNAVKKVKNLYFEAARGSEQENFDYCTKDGVIAVERGKINKHIFEKGCTTKLTNSVKELVAMRVRGTSLVEICENDYLITYVHYGRQIDRIAENIRNANKINYLPTT